MIWYQGFEKHVQERRTLAGLTTYRVGGAAEFYAEPHHAGTLSGLLARARAENIPVRVLGHGTNLLVADTGVRGLVLRLPRTSYGACAVSGGGRVRAGAGHSLGGLVKWTAAQGLTGLECLTGIPGTVGAALRMNAGGRFGEIGASVCRVQGVELDGTPFDLPASECGFGYRRSLLKDRVVTGCELILREGPPAEIQRMMRAIIGEKRLSQPMEARSAGCVFKNPKLPGVASAGRLIDTAGLKSARVGGAVVSPVHANFVVCEGQACAQDVAALIAIIRQRVFETHGVRLEMEVEAWGFDPDELLPAEWQNAA